MSKYIHKRCITENCKKFSTNPVERGEGQEEVHHCKECLKILNIERPTECPICYDEGVELKQLKPCGHWICQSCLDQTIKRDVCSFCRCTIQLTPEERTKYEIDKVANGRQGWVNISLDMDLNRYAEHLRERQLRLERQAQQRMRARRNNVDYRIYNNQLEQGMSERQAGRRLRARQDQRELLRSLGYLEM